MNPDHQSKDRELQQREVELRKREIKIRMRELEAELEQPTPVQATVTTDEPSSSRPWYKRLPDIGKFCLIVLAVIIAVRLATWLATAVMILGIAWAGYKLFLEGDRK